MVKGDELNAADESLFFTNYSTYGIRCPGESDKLYEARPVIELKLRGQDIEDKLNDENFISYNIKKASILLGRHAMITIINDMDALNEFLEDSKFKQLMNYTDSMNIRYIIHTHMLADDIIYKDYIWEISQVFNFEERARMDL